jgi:mediator of RNA polymerase II transcription subunit 4
MEVDEGRQEVEVHEEEVRRFDPNAVFELDLNSDDSDGD